MSAFLKSGVSLLSNFVKPSFYATHWNNLVVQTNKDIRAGSATPIFKGMILVGVIGYITEYVGIGSTKYF